MSKLQELIKELCPDGVEFRKLGEVCEILDSKRQPIARVNVFLVNTRIMVLTEFKIMLIIIFSMVYSCS